MRKNFTLCAAAIIAAATITLASCSKNPADKALSMMKDYTEQIKNANSIEELKSIVAKAEEEDEKFEKEYPDFEPTEAQAEELEKAQDELRAAFIEASEKFGY